MALEGLKKELALKGLGCFTPTLTHSCWYCEKHKAKHCSHCGHRIEGI
jgi:hypothetical protein